MAAHVITTPAGELTYTVFPGPSLFVGATRLDGDPIAPIDARRLLEDAGHDDAGLAFMGERWADGVTAPRHVN